MNASDESGDVDASEQLTGSWLRRAMTGPQPSTLPAAAAPTPKAVPRTTTGARPRASGPAARRKNAEDVRALLGETTMHRILPSTGSGPPSPVLLRRAATVVGSRATRSPGWRWPDFFERPSPPPRRAARAPAGDDCAEEDDSRRPLLRARDAHTTRGAAGAETEASGGGDGGGRVARAPRRPRCAPRRRSAGRGITETPLSCDGPEPGLRRAGRASRAARVSRRKKRTVPIVRGDAEVPRVSRL